MMKYNSSQGKYEETKGNARKGSDQSSISRDWTVMPWPSRDSTTSSGSCPVTLYRGGTVCGQIRLNIEAKYPFFADEAGRTYRTA